MAHNDICTYHIRLHGRVEEDEINALGPLRVIVEAPPLPSPDAAADANAPLMRPRLSSPSAPTRLAWSGCCAICTGWGISSCPSAVQARIKLLARQAGR